MHQHLHQDHLPLKLLKYHIHPLPLLHPVLVNPHQPHLHQVKVQDCHQSHHHERQPPHTQSQTPRYDTEGVGKTRINSLGIILIKGRHTENKIKIITGDWQYFTILTNMTQNQPVWHRIRRRSTSRTSIILTSIWEVNFKGSRIYDKHII